MNKANDGSLKKINNIDNHQLVKKKKTKYKKKKKRQKYKIITIKGEISIETGKLENIRDSFLQKCMNEPLYQKSTVPKCIHRPVNLKAT